MAVIPTTLGPRDDSSLLKTEGLIDTDVERTTWVEYCVLGCDGLAHRTQQPDAESLFCRQHVHRSVHVTLKQAGVIAHLLAGELG
jgi:hypothetical protein